MEILINIPESVNLVTNCFPNTAYFQCLLLDSGNDSTENIGILLERGCHFIIKRNLRKESREDWLRMAKDNSLDVTHPRDGKDVYTGSDWKEITYQAQDGTTKHATIRMGYEIIERTIDKKGQLLLIPDIEANVWWTNTGFTDREAIGHQERGTSRIGQYADSIKDGRNAGQRIGRAFRVGVP